MGKKAALFTWCYFGRVNYGQILQCYATQKLCEEYGLEVMVIKYRPLKEFEKIINIPPKGIEREHYEKYFKDRYIESQDVKQVERFREFISENICMSPQCYSIKDIEEEIEDKDILIVGSDQLWNPAWFDPVFIVEFARKKHKVISIATGGISINKKVYQPVLKRIAKGLEKFDFVSVRETVSREILNAYTDKKIIDVLDPTLLLDERKWRGLCAHRMVEEKYILAYFLGKLTPHKHILKEIARRNKIEKIIYIRMHDSDEEINNEGMLEPFVDAGPREFLSLIRSADIVCTDSFHGFAFSLIFEREFFLMDRAYTNTDEISGARETNVLNKLKIGNRHANSKKDLLVSESIDYISVKKALKDRKKYCRKEIEQGMALKSGDGK